MDATATDNSNAPILITATAPQVYQLINSTGVSIDENDPFLALLKKYPQPNAPVDPITWPEDVDAKNVCQGISSPPLLRFTSYTPSEKEHHFVYPSQDTDLFLMVSVLGETVTIVARIDGEQVARIACTMIDLDHLSEPSNINLELGVQAAASYISILDYLRALTMASMLQREEISSIAFSANDLVALSQPAADKADNRWLCTIANDYFDGDLPSSRDNLEQGCKELAVTGILQTLKNGDNELFRPAATMIAIATDLLLPLPALVLNSEAHGYKSLLVSGHSPWLLQREFNVARFTNLKSIEATRIITNVVGAGLEFEISDPRSSQVSSEASGEVAEPPPPKTKNELEQPTPAKPAPPPAAKEQQNFCLQCGTQLRAQLKFCTSCGATVAGTQ